MDEVIEMQRNRFGYFPRTFLWRGRRYEVSAVKRCWTTGARQWGGRVQRHYFRVRCVEGDFDLFQDLRHNTWHVARFEPVNRSMEKTQSPAGDGVQQAD